jgi:hypothetical protein
LVNQLTYLSSISQGFFQAVYGRKTVLAATTALATLNSRLHRTENKRAKENRPVAMQYKAELQQAKAERFLKYAKLTGSIMNNLIEGRNRSALTKLGVVVVNAVTDAHVHEQELIGIENGKHISPPLTARLATDIMMAGLIADSSPLANGELASNSIDTSLVAGAVLGVVGYLQLKDQVASRIVRTSRLDTTPAQL